MNPKSLRNDRVARPLPSDHEAGGWVVIGPNHTYFKVDAVAGWIFAHADGSRDIDQLLAGLQASVDPAADRAMVFEALDRLADAKLLDQRVAPPAGLSRRVVMQRLLGGAALAALTAALGVPRAAGAAEQCGEDKDLIDEIAYLQTLQGEVADLLEEWYVKADAEPKTDEFYLKALGAEEQKRKQLEQEYVYKLDDATQDLADCKLGNSEKQVKKREAERALHFKKRAQEMDHKQQQAKAKYAASLEKLKADEKAKKAKAAQSAAAEKGQQNQGEASLQHMEKREKALEARHAQESATKAQHRKISQEREAKKKQQLNERLIEAGERTELFAESYALRQSEKAAKDMDQNLVYKLASEAKAKAQESALLQRKQEETAKEKSAKSVSYLK